MNQLQKNKDIPLHNEQIRVPKIRVIVTTDEGEKNLGIIDTKDALRMAYDKNLDLVIINTQVDPQVAKIMDIGKWLYQKSKAEKEKRAADRNRGGQIHELTMRPGIDDHDLDVKMRKIQEWIDDGDRVKITIRFRGRENSRANELGKNLIDRIVSQTGTQREGREEISNNRMSLLLARKTVSK
jgi:translation initiation factor IF-3